MLTDADVAAMEAEVREQVERAAQFAEESPEPAPEELMTNVYANPLR